ncbi:MAG: hypothetical protein ACAI34_07235 [Verrucomicrobium sp.]
MTRKVLHLLLGGLFATQSYGHRLDEYLQAIVVAIEPSAVRVQLTITPGIAVADAAIAQIDGNKDGVVSEKEASDYAETVKTSLGVRWDGGERELDLKLVRCKVPSPADLRTGAGNIEMDFDLVIEARSLTAGDHKLALENRHLGGLSVYLLNAAMPESRAIVIKRQLRNENQRTGEIEFTVDE